MERLKFAIVRAKSNLFAIGVIVFLVFLSYVSDAQIAIGPKMGLAFTSLQGSSATNVHLRSTAFGGAFVNFQLARWFTIQPELLVSQKGATYYQNNKRTVVNLNYFEVPVLAKIRIPIDKVFYPHVLVGPDFAFNTQAKYVATDQQSGTVVTGGTGDIKRSDIGAVIGAGLDIQSKHLFATIDGRYGYAFNYLNSSSTSLLNVRNVGWSVSVGLGFRLFAD